MKTNTLLKITAAIALAFASQQTARAHSDVQIGPNGGRVLAFSPNQTVNGEVVELAKVERCWITIAKGE